MELYVPALDGAPLGKETDSPGPDQPGHHLLHALVADAWDAGPDALDHREAVPIDVLGYRAIYAREEGHGVALDIFLPWLEPPAEVDHREPVVDVEPFGIQEVRVDSRKEGKDARRQHQHSQCSSPGERGHFVAPDREKCFTLRPPPEINREPCPCSSSKFKTGLEFVNPTRQPPRMSWWARIAWAPVLKFGKQEQ